MTRKPTHDQKPIADCRENGGNNNKHKWLLDEHGEIHYCENCGITLKYWGEIYTHKKKGK